MHRIRLFSLSGMAAFGLALSGCVPPDQGHLVDGVVMVAPPAPQVEVIPASPQPEYVWIGGYWNWVGGQHVWVGGRWMAPRPGYHWVAHSWVRVGGGWRLQEGYWARR